MLKGFLIFDPLGVFLVGFFGGEFLFVCLFVLVFLLLFSFSFLFIFFSFDFLILFSCIPKLGFARALNAALVPVRDSKGHV